MQERHLIQGLSKRVADLEKVCSEELAELHDRQELERKAQRQLLQKAGLIPADPEPAAKPEKPPKKK